MECRRLGRVLGSVSDQLPQEEGVFADALHGLDMVAAERQGAVLHSFERGLQECAKLCVLLHIIRENDQPVLLLVAIVDVHFQKIRMLHKHAADVGLGLPRLSAQVLQHLLAEAHEDGQVGEDGAHFPVQQHLQVSNFFSEKLVIKLQVLQVVLLRHHHFIDALVAQPHVLGEVVAVGQQERVPAQVGLDLFNELLACNVDLLLLLRVVAEHREAQQSKRAPHFSATTAALTLLCRGG
mmetsp:Transcript_41583/g.104868  ORF Transcript_41583/g.104868 Transcript_41583/m.104868 type:complete len:238 (+) Transcript_41583:1148-1861(+)